MGTSYLAIYKFWEISTRSPTKIHFGHGIMRLCQRLRGWKIGGAPWHATSYATIHPERGTKWYSLLLWWHILGCATDTSRIFALAYIITQICRMSFPVKTHTFHSQNIIFIEDIIIFTNRTSNWYQLMFSHV